MAKMKDSGIEWIGEIPEDWEVRKVKTVAKYHKDIVGNKSEYFERLALTMGGVIKRSKTDANGLQPDNFDTYQILNEGDLVFKLIDLANIATSRVGLSPYTGIVSSAYIALTSTGIDAKYAEYFFFSMYYRHIFNMLGSEGVRSSLGKDDVLNLPIPVPPLDTQRRITDYLDAKTTVIDEKIAAAKSQIENLKEYRAALIHETVCRGVPGTHDNMCYVNSGIEWIGDVPAEWEVKRVKYLVDIEHGHDPVSEGEIPVYGSGAKPVKYCGEYKNGPTVLLGRKGTLDQPKYIEGKYWNVDTAYNAVNKIGCNLRFFFYMISSFDVNSLSTSTAVPSMTSEEYYNINAPVPSFVEQEQIASYLDEKTKLIDETITNMEQFVTDMEQYRQALIYETVTGKREAV